MYLRSIFQKSEIDCYFISNAMWYFSVNVETFYLKVYEVFQCKNGRITTEELVPLWCLDDNAAQTIVIVSYDYAQTLLYGDSLYEVSWGE